MMVPRYDALTTDATTRPPTPRQVPVIFGLPYWVPALGHRYVDGMFWVSSFVPWRSAARAPVCRVSAFNNFGSNVGPRLTAMPPLWWMLLPPGRRELRGMLLWGYCDMAAHFEEALAAGPGWPGLPRRGPAETAARCRFDL